MQFSFRFQISTLATKLGVRNIALLGSGLLLANYLGAILVATYMPELPFALQAFRRSIMVPTHALLALGLIFQVISYLISPIVPPVSVGYWFAQFQDFSQLLVGLVGFGMDFGTSKIHQ
ncbi:hypothetical protein GW17_00005157, partial [Ensete ventricosum]